MSLTIAFDVYGTLIDPLGIAGELAAVIGDDAPRFSQRWRDKQIEYLFRRALGRQYEPFSVCTAQAFDFTCEQLGVTMAATARQRILDKYTELPAFPGTATALRNLRATGVRSFAFSNGEPEDLESLLAHAGLLDALDGIVSVHETRSYKPDPHVYAHFVATTDSEPGRTWLVSGNPFDVIGAQHAGWNTAWLKRSDAVVFDPWGYSPDEIIDDISDLRERLSKS